MASVGIPRGEEVEEDVASALIKEDTQQVFAVLPLSIAMQPLIVCRTMIQVGYEPLEPVLGKSLFLRKPGYYYPNIFQYMNHIRLTGGWTLLFTGITPKITNILLFAAVDKKIEKLVRQVLPYTGADANLPADRKGPAAAAYDVAVNCASKTCSVIATHPLQVVMIRMVCSIINKDKQYSGFFSTIREIYDTQGIQGFFSGFVPRWIGEMLVVTLGGAIMYGIYRTMNFLEVEDETVRTSNNYNAIVQFLLTGYTYKYQLTATVVAASCPGLNIGLPQFADWRSCYSALEATKQFSRGSSYFFRKALVLPGYA